MRVDVDTDDLPRAKRLEAWRSLISDHYVGLDCEFPSEDFRVVASGQRSGADSFTRITSSRHMVERSRTLINRDRREIIFFGLVLAGSIGFAQGGREAFIEPGAFVLSDSTRPFRTYLGEASDVCWITVPKHRAVQCIGASLEDLTAVAFIPTAPIGPIAEAFLSGLDGAALDVDPPVKRAERLVDQALNLLAMTIDARQATSRLLS